MKTIILITMALLFGGFLVWALAFEDDPKRTNAISTEEAPMDSSILPPDQAITIAQTEDKNPNPKETLIMPVLPS